MRGLRWLSVIAPMVAVAIIELVSDDLLDTALPLPLDTLVVVGIVAVLAWGFSTVAFRRIDQLSAELRARNADLERREASARALHRVSVAIAALDDLDEILAAIVDQARERLGVNVALLLTYRPDGEAYVAAASGLDAGIDRGGGFPGPNATRFVRPDLAVARLEAPLQRAGETIGLLMVGSRLERGFEVDEVETLSSLANQAAIAIENARLQARLRELAVVAERERIAREMHDGLAQVLGYVNTKSQAVEELLAAGRTDEARGLLAELAAAARSIYVDVREAILGLRSPVIPGVGLVAAVEDYAARFAEASKIAVEVDASDGARRFELAPDAEAQVFRIVQEALTNVRKHSGAARAEVSFTVRDSRLEVIIADAGDATEAPAAAADRPRYGLQAMRERAASISATVDWTHPLDGGWQVHLVVAPSATVTSGPAAV
jgi:nitrate/nitrite-specific signal transduction histidine kinase